MAKTTLSRGVVKKIHSAVERLYESAKARFLARPPTDKRLVIGFKQPRIALPDLYQAATASERAKADMDTLRSLVDIASGFIDSQKERMKAHVVKSVQSWLTEAHQHGVKTDLETVLGGELAELWGKATSDMRRIVETETNVAKNTGLLDGILSVNLGSGINDPRVYFIVVRDGDLCDECKKLHLLPDEITPRLWLLSELSRGYHKKGDPRPSLPGEHPNCRCQLGTLMPGFGFDASGMVQYIAPGHDEFKRQRG